MMQEKNNIFITIIIVTYNAGKFIERALASLVPRINDETEVIIVDGLSSDNTISIIDKYGKYVSKICSEKDLGIYDAMNKGTKLANGKFILFLGADDELLIEIDKLDSLLNDDQTIYYGDVIVVPSNKIYGGKFDLPKLLNRNICHQSIFYPREIFSELQFDLTYKLMADYVMNMKLWSSGKYKFMYLNESIARYSLEGQSSTNVDMAFKKDSFKLVYQLFGVYGLFIKMFNPLKKVFNSNYGR